MRKEKGRTKIMGGKEENLNKEREIKKLEHRRVLRLYGAGEVYFKCSLLVPLSPLGKIWITTTVYQDKNR